MVHIVCINSTRAQNKKQIYVLSQSEVKLSNKQKEMLWPTADKRKKKMHKESPHLYKFVNFYECVLLFQSYQVTTVHKGKGFEFKPSPF